MNKVHLKLLLLLYVARVLPRTAASYIVLLVYIHADMYEWKINMRYYNRDDVIFVANLLTLRLSLCQTLASIFWVESEKV